MNLRLLYLLLLIIPATASCQRRISLGLEMTGIVKKSGNVRPFDGYRLYGGLVQLTLYKDSSKFHLDFKTGFSYVKSATYNKVYSIPLYLGIDYQLPGSISFFYGITGGAGTRYIFSNDAGISRLLPSFRLGVYYNLFKGVPLKIGYERIGNSNGVFAQLVIYGFKI